MITNIPTTEYHADKTRISKHGLDLISRAPALYRHSLTAPHKETPALVRGTLLHMAFLEPNRYHSEIAVIPEGIDRRTKEGKSAWEGFLAANPGKMHVSASDDAEIRAMVASLVEIEDVRRLQNNAILSGQTEVTIHGEIGKTRVKARLDGHADGILFDVKTAKSASYRAFQRSAIEYRYHVQAAWYHDLANAEGLGIESVAFFVVESEAPYLSTVFYADDAFLALGRAEYKRDLETYRKCLETHTWPGLPSLQMLTLPAWLNPQQD